MALKAGPGGPRRDARALRADYCSRGGLRAASRRIV